jgi:hypothetical protein
MHDGVDLMLRDEARYQGIVPDVANDEMTRSHRLSESPDQVIENDDLFAGVTELSDDMTSDVSGTAGDQDCPVCQDISDEFDRELRNQACFGQMLLEPGIGAFNSRLELDFWGPAERRQPGCIE